MYLHFLCKYVYIMYIQYKTIKIFCMYACTIYFWEDKKLLVYTIILKISDIYNSLRYKKIQ